MAILRNMLSKSLDRLKPTSKSADKASEAEVAAASYAASSELSNPPEISPPAVETYTRSARCSWQANQKQLELLDPSWIPPVGAEVLTVLATHKDLVVTRHHHDGYVQFIGVNRYLSTSGAEIDVLFRMPK